jgi:protein tyrosine/serine phosphatase
MKKIPTSSGTLLASPCPAGEDLIGYHFDIIWNLAVELKHHAEWEKDHAEVVLLGNINDYDVPGDTFAFTYQLEQVVKCLKNGGSVLVHCLGGHGRTGMAIACILNRLEGLSANVALKTAQQFCRGGPKMDDQIAFVKSVCKEIK